MAKNSSGVGSPEKGSSRFAVLRIRSFRYYWGATLFSLIGEHIENVIRNWLIWQLTHSVFWLMVMVFMHWIPFALFSIPAGSIADRVNRQQLILWAEIGACGAAVAMFVTTYVGLMDQYWMSGLLILHSLSGSISNPSRQLFLHDMVGRENLLSGVALTSSLRFATQSIGKPIGGLILLTFGAAFGYFMNALAYLPLILVLMTVVRVVQTEVPQRRRAFEEFKQGLKHMKADKSILATIGIATAPSIFIGNGFDPFLVIYADLVFGMGAEGYTYLITAMGIGSLIGVLGLGAVGNVRWKGKMLIAGIFGFCISIVIFAVSRSFVLSLIFLLLIGFFQVIYNTSSTALLLENVPSDMRGRVMGIFNFCRLGLRTVNGPFFAIINKLVILTTASAFAVNALTLSAAATTVALVTLSLAIFAPKIRKEN
ncbi:MAG: MFS transporter [Candidatus Binatia bacterium]